MRFSLTHVFVVAAVLALVAPVYAALKVGDPAPPLSVTDWVKGKPFDLAKDGAGKVVVLEFWATWCVPCIQMIPQTNELYHKYKDKAFLLASITDASQGQTLRSVQDFVSKQGARMDYPVAFDRTEKTYTAYVLGSGAYGIPFATVIDKSGKIAWLGHPGEPEMHTVIADLLLDRYDAQAAQRRAALQARLAPLFNEFNQAAMLGDWPKALAATDAVLALDPANFDALRYAVAIYLEELHSVSELRAWAQKFLDAHPDNAEALATVAGLMLASSDVTSRQPDLAIKAADLALQAGGKDALVIQTVADVRFQIGDLDTAIALQRQAIEAANPLEVQRAREILVFYETCKRLQKHG